MAAVALTADVLQALPSLGVNVQVGRASDPVAAAAAVSVTIATLNGAHMTATEAAMAVLEADGASPTQAHVNTMRTAFNTTKADALAVSNTAVVAALGADVTLVFDPAIVLSITRMRRIFDAYLTQLQGSGTLTA